MESDGFPRRLRLRRRAEFVRVQTTGHKHHTRHFLVFVASRVCPSRSMDWPASSVTRFGITVTRKVGNAVVRNQIRRLVREVVRRNHRRLGVGLDMVWVAKRNAKAISYEDIQADFDQLLRRLGVAHGEGS